MVQSLWQYNVAIGIWELLPESQGEEIEKVVCAEFGCGKHLTAGEQLFGSRCVKHSRDRKKKLTEIIDRYI